MKCDDCYIKGMCAHATLTHDDNDEIININKNGRAVQAKISMLEHYIILVVEEDLFVIKKTDLE